MLHHAIGDPALQRRCLPLLQEAAACGDVPAWHPATLLDGISFHEGRPQVYGTVFDWHGDELGPWEIEEREGVDERRALVGLPSLAEQTASVREAAAAEGDLPPADPAGRREQAEAWARSVGWR